MAVQPGTICVGAAQKSLRKRFSYDAAHMLSQNVEVIVSYTRQYEKLQTKTGRRGLLSMTQEKLDYFCNGSYSRIFETYLFFSIYIRGGGH